MLYRRRRTPGASPKAISGERDISGFDWPFTPIHGSSLRFQPKWVRPSTGLTPASACPWIAHRVCGIRLRRPFKDSPSLRLGSNLNLAARRLAGSFYKRHAVTALGAPTACGAHGFRYCFTPLPGCFSPFPHGTRPLSVAGECLALGGGPPASDRFHVPGPTGNPSWGGGFAYGAVTRCGRPFHAVPLPPVLLPRSR